MPVYDHGALRAAQTFVAVLGASSYAYAEATWTQALPDWTASHVRAFGFFEGVTEIVVPDNLKSGVNIPAASRGDIYYYSVPHQLVGKELDLRLTATTIEAFYKGRRVASHVRKNEPYRFTTIPAHRPPNHRAYAE